MAKILTFFNHKGGVGKTTSSYGVAWSLCKLGKRVLMIDADAQCNLTEITVGSDYLDDNSGFFLKNNIYEYLVRYVQPKPGEELPRIETFEKEGIDNLKLLSGSVRLAELERSIALSFAPNVTGLGHVPTSVYSALNRIGEEFDFIILDLSPALSATNQLLLMLSDYFIIPANPSIFSRQALINLGGIFKSWNRELSGFEVFITNRKPLPKMLGMICQNYRPYSRKDEDKTQSAQRFAQMMNELNKYAEALAKELSGFNMALTIDEFTNTFENKTPYRIADIPDFNQLIVISEKENVPVVALDNKILNRNEMSTPYYVNKVRDFIEQYNSIAQGLVKL